MKSSRPYIFLYATVAYSLLLTFSLLFPFDFYSKVAPKVKWLSNEHGIEIVSPSLIRSRKPPEKLHNKMMTGSGMTLEVWLSSNSDLQGGPARILSYSYHKYLRNFTLAQEGKNLVFRLRTTASDLNGKPEMLVKDVFTANTLQHIVVTYDFTVQKVYVNGKRVMSSNRKGHFDNWDPSHTLVLGNEATGNRPWLGKIYKIAIYNQALTHQDVLFNYNSDKHLSKKDAPQDHNSSKGLIALYLFENLDNTLIIDHSGVEPGIDLNIPHTFVVIKKTTSLPSLYENFAFNFKNRLHILLNIFIFFPFGLFFYAFLKGCYQTSLKPIGIVILSGILFTFSIEYIQFFIESRISSITDALSNSLGTIFGVIILELFSRHFSSFSKRGSEMESKGL